MLESALAGKNHGCIGFVAGFDGLVIVGRSARLNNRRHPFMQSDIDPVPEWEESVTDHGGPDQATLLLGHPIVDLDLFVFVLHVIVCFAVGFEAVAISQLTVGLVSRDFGNSNPVLFTGTDTDGHLVFDVDNGVGCNPRFDQPAEQKVVVFFIRWFPVHPIRLAFVVALRQLEFFSGAGCRHKRPLGDDATIDQGLELDATLTDESVETVDVSDPHHPQVFLRGENVHDPVFETRRHDHLGIMAGDGFGSGLSTARFRAMQPPNAATRSAMLALM